MRVVISDGSCPGACPGALGTKARPRPAEPTRRGGRPNLGVVDDRGPAVAALDGSFGHVFESTSRSERARPPFRHRPAPSPDVR
jgi:hypothetical protein